MPVRSIVRGSGLVNLDSHFLIVTDPDLPRLSGCIFHDGGVFYIFEVGREAAEILRGLVHHVQHAVDGPLRRGLRMRSRSWRWHAATSAKIEGIKRLLVNRSPYGTRLCGSFNLSQILAYR